jgi:hypothetical protein
MDSTAKVSITTQNAASVAADNVATGVTVSVLANDKDADNDALTINSVSTLQVEQLKLLDQPLFTNQLKVSLELQHLLTPLLMVQLLHSQLSLLQLQTQMFHPLQTKVSAFIGEQTHHQSLNYIYLQKILMVTQMV